MIIKRKGCVFMHTKEAIQFASFQDQLQINGTMVKPAGEIRGIVQFVHGMSEHHERYLPLMEFLADAGFLCVIHDHRGHGGSVKTNEDFGYFYERSGTYIVEDAHQLTYLMKKEYGNLPYFLFGHSMGSLVVRAYTKKYDYEIDGLIVCGSPSKNPAAFAGQLLVMLMTKLKGGHYRSPLIQKIAFGSFNKRFNDAKSENTWLCTDEEVVRVYDEDERCGFVFTLNGFENLFRLMRNVYNDEKWIMRNPKLPIYFIAGKDDPCIISETKFHEACDFMRRLGYKNVKQKVYAGMRHEILNEVQAQVVFDDVLAFIDGILRERLF